MKRLFLLLISLGFTAFAAPNPPTAEDPKIAISPVVRSMEQLGGTGAINTSGSGTWKASVSSSWIHLTATSGTAGYAVGYTVDANNEVEQRIGYVYVSGYVHTITQDGIGATLDQSSADFEWEGGNGSVSVSAPSGKTWHAKSNVSWISVTSSTGTGASSVRYTVAKLDEVSTRSGTLTIADRTFTVNQTGRRMKLKEYSSSSDYLADTVKIKVNALASTEWSVSKNVDWITITDAGNGRGGDTVEIGIAENPSYNARSGKVTIGTETFTVSQQGRDSLVFRIGKTEAEYDENGISLERVAVTATPDLGWTAKSGVDWIEVSSSAKSGSGDGSFTYKVKPNPTLYPRSGEITVTAASATVPVKRLEITQKAAVASLSMSSYTFESAKESVQLDLATGAIVGWDVINSNSWLTVVGATKVGSCTLTLTAAQNTSVRSRSGVVRIADHDFVVTQRGRGVKLSYEERVFNTDGKTTGANAENVITVTTDSDVSWAAIASDPTWIVIYQGMSGTGNGTIKFVVAPYVGAGEIRKGTITVGDQTVYVTQRPYELSIDPKGEWVDSNAGAGEIQVAMDINKVWEAISTEPWLIIIQKYDSGTGNGKVLFQFTENTTGRQRTGKIMIAGETYTLTQEARQTATIDAVVESHGGTVSGGGIYDIGAELTLTAVADDGYEFDCWLLPGGGTSKNPFLKTTVASAGTYAARFVPAKLNLKVELACLKGVRLGWANLAWATQYRIWRGTSSVRAQATQIGTLNADGTCTYMDESGVTGQLYWYWVEAVGAEEQTWSEAFAGTRAQGTFAITYENLRGTTHANPSQYTEGAAVSLKVPSARVGYTFVGWEPSAITADTTGNVTVYALWEQNTYAVQFNANGGRGEMPAENFTYGFWKYLTPGEFTRPAYTFMGWALQSDGTQEYDDKESVKNLTSTQSGTVPLYALWTRTAGMGLISYQNLKGATHSNPECYDEGDAFAFTAPTAVTGYTFAKWIPAGITTETRGDVTVQADWTANKYRIVYDGNGGEGTTAASDCEYGTEYEAAGSGFSRTGYSFTGWSTNVNGEVVYLPGAAVSNLTAVSGGSVTFYAVWETNRYQVVFNANGGSGTMDPQEFLYFEEHALAANAFAKMGYGFAGWATNAAKAVVFADREVVSNLTTVADGEVNLYAKWTANAYSVKFNANGGSGEMADEPMTYDAEKALTACAFTRKGYTFAGWAMGAGGAVKYANGAAVKNLAASGTVTLYAKWTPNSYVIDFNPGQGGGGSMPDQPMTYDEEAALYANLFARTGYTFLGWTDDEGELEEVLFYDGVVVSNLTDEVDGEFDLYAVWAANEYTVKFAANGGTGTMADQAFLYDEEQSLRANGFARTGYTFAGWNGNAGGVAKQFADGEIVSNLTSEVDGVVTMSAVWTANPYTVRFDANGGEGTMGDLNCMYGTGKALTACAFTRTGYTFAGWAKSAGGAVMYADRASVTDVAASGTVTLYAKWTAISYSVKFNANGGSGSMSNESMSYNSAKALTACAFTKTGYTFAGWATNANGEVVYGNGQFVKNLTATQGAVVNLYAKWTANGYAVAFNANGGQGTMANESMTYDTAKALTACAFTRKGYTFAGWATSVGGAVKYVNGATVKNLTATAGGTVTLYAKWTPNNYVIDFNPGQGGEGSMSDQPMTYDEAEALYPNLFHRTGYTFLGWADDPNEVEEVLYYDGVVVENLTDEVDGEFDLYAIWAANEYTVKFNANGGKGTMADQDFLYDEGQNLTSNGFARAGCEFLGWATSAAGDVVYADGETVSNLTATADGVVNLYAVWDGTATTWMEDDSFSSTVANTYDGYMIDESCNLLGIVQVKTTKQSVKTTTDKKTKVKTVTTNITATATVTDANGKKWSYSKGVVTVDGAVSGLKCTTKGCPAPEFGATLGQNGMEGAWGEYAIFGARNGMGTKGDAMMTALEAYKGKWSVTIGAVRLQLDVQAKGVVKIAGNWENGAKVSASAQMVMGDGFSYVPVMVKVTKTSPALNALLRIDPEGGVALLSATDPARPESAPYQLVAGGRSVDELGEPVYCPSEVSAGGKAFLARVAVNELAYPAKFAAKKLPAGLKIDAATGVISGTPTKPGHYVAEVTVTSGLNSKVKETITVEFDIANYTDDLILIEDSYGPYYVGVSTVEQIAAASDCSVSGLPSGLKWTAKDIVDSKTKAVKTAANTVYGVPTKACTNTVYFKKSVKETVDGKTKTVAHQASATFVIEGMQPWAVGTFNGGSANGMVTLTVSNVGKISGKWISEGLTWTLSAASFDAYVSSAQMYVATVVGKSGKLVMTNEIEVTEGGVVAYDVRGEDTVSTTWEAWKNEWKEASWTMLAKQLNGKKMSVGDVALSVGSSGTVTAKGAFVGLDGKTYSASCSTVLIPTAEAGLYRVYLYFPPKAGKFDGFTDVVEIGLGE